MFVTKRNLTFEQYKVDPEGILENVEIVSSEWETNFGTDTSSRKATHKICNKF